MSKVKKLKKIYPKGDYELKEIADSILSPLLKDIKSLNLGIIKALAEKIKKTLKHEDVSESYLQNLKLLVINPTVDFAIEMIDYSKTNCIHFKNIINFKEDLNSKENQDNFYTILKEKQKILRLIHE